MIISRTPLRVSFFGGGTDYPVFYREDGGAVISTSIDKYSYVICRYLPPFFDYSHVIRYRQREETNTVDEIQHPSVRECLLFTGIERGVEIQHNADLPAMSGLGSSSAFTVGLLNALRALGGEMPTKRGLALDAIHVEQERIGENVGSQDQVVAAFGGLNRIEFGGPQEIAVSPITIPPETREALQSRLMLFFTRFPRSASEVAAEQIRRTPEKRCDLRSMRQMVDDAIAILCGKGNDLDDFGRLLDESWQIKRGLTSAISNSFIDGVYETAVKAGAVGGKLLGAGGGGFILFFVNPERQSAVLTALGKLLYVPFAFESLGSQIVYYAPEKNLVEVERSTDGHADSCRLAL